jgi:predicted transcriptional regulator YheO
MRSSLEFPPIDLPPDGLKAVAEYFQTLADYYQRQANKIKTGMPKNEAIERTAVETSTETETVQFWATHRDKTSQRKRRQQNHQIAHELHAAGQTQAAIARHLNVSQPTIHRLLKAKPAHTPSGKNPVEPEHSLSHHPQRP